MPGYNTHAGAIAFMQTCMVDLRCIESSIAVPRKVFPEKVKRSRRSQLAEKVEPPRRHLALVSQRRDRSSASVTCSVRQASLFPPLLPSLIPQASSCWSFMSCARDLLVACVEHIPAYQRARIHTIQSRRDCGETDLNSAAFAFMMHTKGVRVSPKERGCHILPRRYQRKRSDVGGLYALGARRMQAR